MNKNDNARQQRLSGETRPLHISLLTLLLSHEGDCKLQQLHEPTQIYSLNHMELGIFQCCQINPENATIKISIVKYGSMWPWGGGLLLGFFFFVFFLLLISEAKRL